MGHYDKEIQQHAKTVNENDSRFGFDVVNKPKHYNNHPSGVECIQVVEHLSYCIGNAIKYLWRYQDKNGIEDLRKSVWYINREIERLEK